MKIELLNRTSNELRFKIRGEGHSFCSALQSILRRDKAIDFSGYHVPHPLAAEVEIYVRTKGKQRPEDTLLKAASTLKEELSDLQDVFKKAFEAKK